MLSEVVKLIVKTMVLNRLAKHRETFLWGNRVFFSVLWNKISNALRERCERRDEERNVHRDPFPSSNNVKVGANSRLHCWFSNDFFFLFFVDSLGVGLDDGKDRFVGDIRHARRNDRSKRLFFRIAILSANCSDCVYTAIFARASLRSIISYNGTIYGGDGEIFWNFIAVESWREIYATWNRKYNYHFLASISFSRNK